jgi:4-amino-4-deoxy-L-arabinose transferase-like glycosyltransferase
MKKEGQFQRFGLIGALLLGAFLMTFRLDPYLTDIDSWRQTETATMARNFLQHPSILFPRIAWGAPGPGIVESEFALFPWLVHWLYRAFGENPLWGRLLSSFFMLAALFNFSRFFHRILPSATASLATLILVTMPLFVRMGRAFMPEATAMFFLSFSLPLVVDGIREERRSRFFAAGVFLLLASLVKPTCLVFGLIVAILVIRHWGVRGLFRKEVIGFGLIVLLPLAGFLAHAATLHAEYGNTFGVLSGGDSKWGNLAMWANYSFWGRLLKIEARWVFSFAGLFLGLVGILWPLRVGPTRLLAVSFLALTLYLALVGRYSSFDGRGSHYHLWMTPFAAAAIAWGVTVLWEQTKKPIQALGSLLLLLVFAQNLWNTTKLLDPGNPNTILRQAGLAVEKLTGPEESIVVLSIDPKMEQGSRGKLVPNNFEMPNIFFHAHRKGVVLPRDEQSPGGLIERLKKAHARVFVNIPFWNNSASPGFRAFLETRMQLEVEGKGFELWVMK